MPEFTHVVLGASGHIGRTVTSELQAANIPFLALTHGEASAKELIASGVNAKAVDVMDTAALQSIFRNARRAFLLNPPADPKSDTDDIERATATSIADALDGSGLEKVVVASTYGAQPGERIGDLSVLYGFEQKIERTGIPAAVNRGAYYYTNLEPLLDESKKGTIATPFPEDLLMPMVSPIDLGKQAALRLLSLTSDVGVRYVEGPERYTFLDVAAAFADALGHAVLLKTILSELIEASYKELGFSDAAADAYARMMKASIDGVELPEDPIHGGTRLSDYLDSLVAHSENKGTILYQLFRPSQTAIGVWLQPYIHVRAPLLFNSRPGRPCRHRFPVTFGDLSHQAQKSLVDVSVEQAFRIAHRCSEGCLNDTPPFAIARGVA